MNNLTQSPTAPSEPKTRRDPVAHIDTLKGTIKFAIPITSTDFESLKAANDLLSRAVAVLTGGKAYAEADASLGRTRGDLLS